MPAKNNSDKLYALDFLERNNINYLITLPSFINQVSLSIFEKDKKIQLDTLILCGEPFYSNLLDKIEEKFSPKYLFNSYGSTETSPWAFIINIRKRIKNLLTNLEYSQ